MKKIIKNLQKGWREKAKELGAMTRNSGVIRDAESLLRLNIAVHHKLRIILFEFQCSSMEVTTSKEGERLTRRDISENARMVHTYEIL